ncbi:MAG: hypothetical protein GYB66_14010, partial [Chloroflexi bacterium]|nr:hypothetical protein [Chloroflexota bacterium]
MRRLLVAGLLVATLGIIGLWSPATQAQDPCNGLVSPRLQIGDTARVLFNGDGLGSALRDNPGKEQSGSRFVTTMPEGTVITVLEGPVCLDGMVWWQVSVPDGTQGWVAEGDAQQYYLEPFVLATEVLEPVYAPPRELQRWEVRYSGNVTTLVPLAVPYAEPRPAREVWQQPDIDAANAALAERRASCPDVLEDTPWEGVTDAGDAIVPEGEYDYYPSPDGGKVFLVRHFVLPIPECGGAPGPYFGISTTHLLREDRDIIDLFPYGQHGGVRSREACMSPDVDNLAWTTNLSEVVWSPDGDTVALTVRYLDQDTAGRPCAYYFVFLVDVFNGNVTPVAEGRRTFWASGGTRLHYLSFTVDNGYNILEERLMALSDSQTTQVNVSTAADGGVQFVPGSFNSTGVVLPVTADGTRVLVCNT